MSCVNQKGFFEDTPRDDDDEFRFNDALTHTVHLRFSEMTEINLNIHEEVSILLTALLQIKDFFLLKNIDNFLISPQKHMLWVLIRCASLRRF